MHSQLVTANVHARGGRTYFDPGENLRDSSLGVFLAGTRYCSQTSSWTSFAFGAIVALPYLFQ